MSTIAASALDGATIGGPPVGTPAPLRVSVVTPIPTPYRDAFWQEFASSPGIDLTVYYCASGKEDRPWEGGWPREFRHETLPGRNLLKWRGADASLYWNSGLVRRLNAGRFDALLVGGYNHLTMWSSMRWAVRAGVPFLLMCESHLHTRRPAWKERAKRPLLRWIVRHAAGFLPTGRWAAEFLEHYGAAREAMTFLPNVPDVERIEREIAALRSQGDDPAPARFQGRRVVLFVGRLIPKKRAELLLRAFHAVRAEQDAVLAIVGDGPLRGELERLASELGIAERVHFAGFVQPDAVLRWYARSSLFVLPSSETWGVAVLEALAAGVPVIVSDEVGCSAEFDNSGSLATVVAARSQSGLAQALVDRLGYYNSVAVRTTAWQGVRQTLTLTRLSASLAKSLRTASARGAGGRKSGGRGYGS